MLLPSSLCQSVQDSLLFFQQSFLSFSSLFILSSSFTCPSTNLDHFKVQGNNKPNINTQNAANKYKLNETLLFENMYFVTPHMHIFNKTSHYCIPMLETSPDDDYVEAETCRRPTECEKH